MKVDKAKAARKQFSGAMYYCCSEHCLHARGGRTDRGDCCQHAR